MDWSLYLLKGETLLWEGRPAPRCYVFRNWRLSIFGLALLAVSAIWLGGGLEIAGDYPLGSWVWLPVPFVLASLYLAAGHLIWSRLEWEGVFFAITDRRLLVLKGMPRRLRGCPLADVVHFRLRPLGENLATLKVTGRGAPSPLVLACIERPEKAVELLRRALEGEEGGRGRDSV